MGMELVDFLDQEIEEDESWAEEVLRYASGLGVTREWRWVRFYAHEGASKKHPSSSSFHKGCPTPEWVLAQCKAYRAIMEEHRPTREGGPCKTCEGGYSGHDRWPCTTVRALVSVYADRECYQKGWA